MSDDNIVFEIQVWIESKCGRNFLSDELYLESGIFDSFDLIELISFIEERYGIRFSSEEFQSTEFHTIKGIQNIIQKKLENA